MRDFIDFIKDIIKDSDKEVNEEYIGHEEVHRHRYGRNPSPGHTLFVPDPQTARWINVRGKHFPV